jgi:hypothetical protein
LSHTPYLEPYLISVSTSKCLSISIESYLYLLYLYHDSLKTTKQPIW